MLSAASILHNAFRETLDYRGKYAFVPQLLRDAERYLKGDVIAQPGLFSKFFYYSPEHVDIPNDVCLSHTCMDYPVAVKEDYDRVSVHRSLRGLDEDAALSASC